MGTVAPRIRCTVHYPMMSDLRSVETSFSPRTALATRPNLALIRSSNASCTLIVSRREKKTNSARSRTDSWRLQRAIDNWRF
jgi:hypothetical protein